MVYLGWARALNEQPATEQASRCTRQPATSNWSGPVRSVPVPRQPATVLRTKIS